MNQDPNEKKKKNIPNVLILCPMIGMFYLFRIWNNSGGILLRHFLEIFGVFERSAHFLLGFLIRII